MGDTVCINTREIFDNLAPMYPGNSETRLSPPTPFPIHIHKGVENIHAYFEGGILHIKNNI